MATRRRRSLTLADRSCSLPTMIRKAAKCYRKAAETGEAAGRFKLESKSPIKYIRKEGNRLVIAFRIHDGIFPALLQDREICQRLQAAYESGEHLSFTFDAQLRITATLR